MELLSGTCQDLTVPVRSPCISLAQRQQHPFLAQALKTLPSPRQTSVRKNSSPKNCKLETSLGFPQQLSQALPGAPLGTGRKQGHQHHGKGKVPEMGGGSFIAEGHLCRVRKRTRCPGICSSVCWFSPPPAPPADAQDGGLAWEETLREL